MTLEIFDKAFASAAYDGGDLHRVAMTGFCWGGMSLGFMALITAEYTPVSLGMVVLMESAHQKNYWPIDLAGQVQAPMPGLYGGADPTILRELIVKFQDQLYKNGAPAQIKIYDGAPHGFCADYRKTYRSDAAKRRGAKCAPFLSVIMFRALKVLEVAYDSFDLPIAIT
jgi:carboxymethylenebutenolidase